MGTLSTPHRAGILLQWITPLAQPRTAGLVALCIYLIRAAIGPFHFQATTTAYFNNLPDAFLHGQLSLRLYPTIDIDLISYGAKTYLYWPPFPALLISPLVALFGVTASDIYYGDEIYHVNGLAYAWRSRCATAGVGTRARFHALRAADSTLCARIARDYDHETTIEGIPLYRRKGG